MHRIALQRIERGADCPRTIVMSCVISRCVERFHKDIICPSRVVFLRTNYCYVCERTVPEDCSITYVGNISGRLGYVACVKCQSIVPRLFEIYAELGSWVPRSIYDGYDLSAIRFLRKSASRPSLPIYIETGSIALNVHSPLIRMEDRIRSYIWWNEERLSIPVEKSVCLSNLIFYNRGIYGYSPECGPFSRTASCWQESLQGEYDKANEFMLVNMVGLPSDIRREIFLFWRGELL